jgi:hypothetical protein
MMRKKYTMRRKHIMSKKSRRRSKMTNQSTVSAYQSTGSQKTGTYSLYSSYSCHKGFTEIYPGVFIGRKRDVDEVLSKVNVLFPLIVLMGISGNKGILVK